MNVKLILTALWLTCKFGVHAQVQQKEENNEIYRAVAVRGRAPEDFQEYLSRNMIYPAEALKYKKEGLVTVELVIEKDGSVSNTRVVRGMDIGYGIPEEALRLINTSPKWSPAITNGVVVRSYAMIPIKFSIPPNGIIAGKEIIAPGMFDPIPPKPGSEQTKGDDNKIYKTPEIAPQPDFDQNKFLNDKLRYPELAQASKVQGQIQVQFVVEKNGNLTDIKVVKGAELGHGLPEEAIRVISIMPKWKPAMQNSRPVRAYYLIPMNFRLQ